jgi:hypothetical protein
MFANRTNSSLVALEQWVGRFEAEQNKAKEEMLDMTGNA